MGINKVALVIISALSMASTAALAADTTTVNGGTVHFKGEVVNAACAVDAGSIDQTVQMGQVRSANLDSDPRQQRQTAGIGWRNLQQRDHAERWHQRHSIPGSLLRYWRGNGGCGERRRDLQSTVRVIRPARMPPGPGRPGYS